MKRPVLFILNISIVICGLPPPSPLPPSPSPAWERGAQELTRQHAGAICLSTRGRPTTPDLWSSSGGVRFVYPLASSRAARRDSRRRRSQPHFEALRVILQPLPAGAPNTKKKDTRPKLIIARKGAVSVGTKLQRLFVRSCRRFDS